MDLPIGGIHLGFRDPLMPGWLQDFARNFGGRGHSFRLPTMPDQKYERNVFGPAQLESFAGQLRSPRVARFIDQEGGKVRLKRGFIRCPAPAIRAIDRFGTAGRFALLCQMRQIRIDVNLSPIVISTSTPTADVGSSHAASLAIGGCQRMRGRWRSRWFGE
jgi:beta-N-acetylhexosaminidase